MQVHWLVLISSRHLQAASILPTKLQLCRQSYMTEVRKLAALRARLKLTDKVSTSQSGFLTYRKIDQAATLPARMSLILPARMHNCNVYMSSPRMEFGNILKCRHYCYWCLIFLLCLVPVHLCTWSDCLIIFSLPSFCIFMTNGVFVYVVCHRINVSIIVKIFEYVAPCIRLYPPIAYHTIVSS